MWHKWQSRAGAARKAHNLEVAGASPVSATTASAEMLTLRIPSRKYRHNSGGIFV